MELRPARIEDVPVLELSGLALSDGTERPDLLAIGDRNSVLVAQEKCPPLLVEFGPADADAVGVAADSLAAHDDVWACPGDRLEALAAWKLNGLDDISDLSVSGGVLYCLSDQSCRVVAVELPLDPRSGRADAAEHWDLKVPERSGEPAGKPEGLVVTADGTFIVGLDTRTPEANLCWYPW